MRRPSRRSWRRSAPSSPRLESRLRSPVVRTASHFACWPIAGPGHGEERFSASPSTTGCAPNREPKPPRCGAGSRPAPLPTERSAGKVHTLSQRFRSRLGLRDSRCSPAGAGGRVCSIFYSAINGRIRPRPRSSVLSVVAASTASQPWHRFAWRWNRRAVASVCFAPSFPCPATRSSRPWSAGISLGSTTRLTAIPVMRAHAWQRHWHSSESEGLSASRLASVATRAASDRAALERLCTDLLAACARPSHAGFVTLDPDVLRQAPPALAARALGCVVSTVSGTPYSPRQERLERLACRLIGDEIKASDARWVPRGAATGWAARRLPGAVRRLGNLPAYAGRDRAVGPPIRHLPWPGRRRRAPPRSPTRHRRLGPGSRDGAYRRCAAEDRVHSGASAARAARAIRP